MTEGRLLVAHIFYPSLIVAVAVISILGRGLDGAQGWAASLRQGALG